jgi:hypothetical protein
MFRSCALVLMAVLPAAAIGIGITSPERLLEQAYSAPIHRVEALWSPQAPALDVKPVVLAPKLARKPFAIGDRLTIDARGGATETIEITGIEQVDGAALGLDGVAFQMVTGRSENDPEGTTLRFLFAVDSPEKPRAL